MEYTEYENDYPISWLDLAMEVQTLAVDGLRYSNDPCDILRFRKIRLIAEKIIKEKTQV